MTTSADSVRIAYADPPYPGQARRHYSGEALCQEVNHRLLIGTLCQYYDRWALSTSSTALQEVLSLCPEGVRVAAWVKPFCSYKPNVNPAYTWEPVIFSNARRRDRYDDKVKDHIIEVISLRTPMPGRKPDRFSYWLFDLLGAEPGDEFHDLFPGSGAVSRAWERFVRARSGLHEPLTLFEA